VLTKIKDQRKVIMCKHALGRCQQQLIFVITLAISLVLPEKSCQHNMKV